MKKYWEKNRIAVIVAIVVIGTCVLLAAKNWNERSFFTAGLTDLITILLGLGKTTVDNTISILKKKGFIERVGSNKTGYWKVLN